MTKTKVKAKTKLKLIREKALLGLWSKAVKVRDGYKCAYCGAKDNLESHHIFSRRHAITKYDMDNGVTLCKYHHTMIEKSYDLKQWLINWVGQDKYNELDRLHYQLKKWTEAEKKAIKESLREFIKQNA